MTMLSKKTRRGIAAVIRQYKKALNAEALNAKMWKEIQKYDKKELKPMELEPEPEETGFFLDISYNGDVSFDGLASKAASRLKEEPVMVNPEILCYLREKGFKVYLHCFYGAYNLATLLVFP